MKDLKKQDWPETGVTCIPRDHKRKHKIYSETCLDSKSSKVSKGDLTLSELVVVIVHVTILVNNIQ